MADTQADVRSDNLTPVRGYSAQDEHRHVPEGRTFTWGELKAIWGAPGEQERRAETARMLAIYNNEWLIQLNEAIRAQYIKENHSKLLQKADTTLNILRSVAQELGGIYDVPASRTVEVDGEESSEGLEPYLAHGTLDDCLAELAPLGWVTRELFIKPLVKPDGSIVLDVATPDQVAFVQNAVDPTLMDAIIIDLGEVDTGDEVEQRYEVWTTENTALLDAGFEPVPDPENPEFVNRFGLIPWVKFNASFPARGKWHLSDSFGVRDATIVAGIQKTDHNNLRHLQSHKQLVATSNDTDEDKIESKLRVMADPSSCIHWRDGSIDVLDMQANLREHLETLIESVDLLLNQYGINADVARGKQVASSGYALMVSMHKQRKVWSKYQRSWSRCEQALYQVARVVHAHQCAALGIDCPPLPEGRLMVSHGDLGPESNPLEQAQLAKELQEAGWSKQATWREVWGKDDDWITQNLAELDEERGPVPAASADPAPPTPHEPDPTVPPDDDSGAPAVGGMQ